MDWIDLSFVETDKSYAKSNRHISTIMNCPEKSREFHTCSILLSILWES